MNSYDLVVVGAGPGGCAAACEAAEQGASVALVEASPAVGGNAARSTGYMAFADTPAQREAGVRDSAEMFFSDIQREVERRGEQFPVQFNAGIARRHAELSAEAYGYLTDMGAAFGPFVPRPWVHSVDRMTTMDDVGFFEHAFADRLERAGVTVLPRTRVLDAIKSSGRIVGVQAQSEGARGPVELLGTHGVVLATGTYHANAAIRSRYQTAPFTRTPYLGMGTARGDGHVIAQRLGADLINMGVIPLFVIIAGGLLEDCIAVTPDGRRFHNEVGPYDDRASALVEVGEGNAHYVFDAAARERNPAFVNELPGPVIESASVAELAEAIGCDAAGLSATVRQWNDARDQGRDEEFGRETMGGGVTRAPYYASPMVLGVTFPSGGAAVTDDMEVVDVLGRTIPGLYAVGDAAGGLSVAVFMGGLRIAPALTLGRLAGRHALAQTPTSEPRQVGPSMLADEYAVPAGRRTRMMLHD